MRRTAILCTLPLIMLCVAACNQEEPAGTTAQPAPESETPAATDVNSARITGTVTETMNAAGYTYVQVNAGSEKVWAAAPEFQVKVGDQVVVPEGAPMRDFHSATLDRDFELVYFVQSITDGKGRSLTKQHGMPAGHPSVDGTSTPAELDLGGITKAEGGKTIAELFAAKADLSGKEVTLRGKVVKFIPNIMGKNWLHLQDGSGDAFAGTDDLTVTTKVIAKVGDTVLVSGPVTLDKDFGAGYKYDVIIEDAKLTIE